MLSVRLSVMFMLINRERKVIETSNLVEICSVVGVTDRYIFGQKGQRLRSPGPTEFSIQWWYWATRFHKNCFCGILSALIQSSIFNIVVEDRVYAFFCVPV